MFLVDSEDQHSFHLSEGRLDSLALVDGLPVIAALATRSWDIRFTCLLYSFLLLILQETVSCMSQVVLMFSLRIRSVMEFHLISRNVFISSVVVSRSVVFVSALVSAAYVIIDAGFVYSCFGCGVHLLITTDYVF